MPFDLTLLPHHCHLVHEGDRNEKIGEVDIGATNVAEPWVAVIKWVSSCQVQRGIEGICSAECIVELTHLGQSLPGWI